MRTQTAIDRARTTRPGRSARAGILCVLVLLAGGASTVQAAAGNEVFGDTECQPMPVTCGATGSPITFRWLPKAEGGSYWIYVGTRIGAHDVYNTNRPQQTLSLTLYIPRPGDTVYIRLWWKKAEQWQHLDYEIQTAP